MSNQPKQLYRSRTNRMIGGVCSGLGDFFGIDPTLVRLLFVFGAIFFHVPLPGGMILVYLVLLVVVPEEPVSTLVPPYAPPAPVQPGETPAETPANDDNPQI